jgi:CRP/FNR family nitrogen fixation transcriptional regulator
MVSIGTYGGMEDHVNRASSELIGALVGGSSRELTCESLERLAIVSQYGTGQPVYRSNEAADNWFRLLSGAARKTTLSSDGRRHIVDFLLPGDFFGFCASSGYAFNVEVIEPGTRIARYTRDTAERLADSDPQVARLVRRTAFASINRLQRRTVILGCRSALEKVSAFLLEMLERGRNGPDGRYESNGRHGPDSSFYLPMSRYDIADYVALAVETLCRTLTSLRTRGAIAFPDARRIRICDRRVLERISHDPNQGGRISVSGESLTGDTGTLATRECVI